MTEPGKLIIIKAAKSGDVATIKSLLTDDRSLISVRDKLSLDQAVTS